MKKRYIFAQWASFCYVIFIILSIFTSQYFNLAISVIAQLSILPYLFIKLKQLIHEKYDYDKIDIMFNILAFLFIIPTILMLFTSNNTKYIMTIFRIEFGLISIRGLVFIIIGALLLKIHSLNFKPFKILIVSMFLFGMITLVTGIISTAPIILAKMPKSIAYMYILVFGWGKAITQIILYGILGYLFRKNKINGKSNMTINEM